ncbi:HNH endonuclease [Allosphingosinicella flava]|uniref:HNH endonuclease n=1 Tax=Allosphingosinicella flava TaxID=2771430 RepID=A0A7T2GIV5_9SPHN|nr:HNH endonuclease [Sphingosinicella flava]QPQ54664.1 HNH endonuclease [Sphingosinicella flava]
MSLGLRQLSAGDRKTLIQELWASQNGKCYISDSAIDLLLHEHDLDIDHVIPTRDGGKDDKSNWALTFSSYNRSKQASDLRIARILARLEAMRSGITDPRGINLGHILDHSQGGRHPLKFQLSQDKAAISYSYAAVGDPSIRSAPLFRDKLSDLEYVFLHLPIEYLFHDDTLNPRGIGNNIRGLIEEFFRGFPQLHVPLGWIDTTEEGGSRVRIFDGQHKAAAQILLGVRALPIRLFVNPDRDLLLTANTRAGTTLRQVAFDKATQRHLGASILRDRVLRFLSDRQHPSDYTSFTEQQLVDHFKGEQAQMKRYIIDAQRNDVTYHPDNRLRDFIEMGGKGTERPISYSAVEKAIYSQMIFGGMLDTPADYKSEAGENPRDLEREQIVRFLNLVAAHIYVGFYDFEVGSGKIESKVQKGEVVPDEHLRAHRMGREEILYAWIELAMIVCQTSVIAGGKTWDKDRPFHKPLSEQVWKSLEHFVINFSRLPLWKNRSLSATIFGGKQNFQFWKDAFATGTANGIHILAGGGVSLIDLMNEPS